MVEDGARSQARVVPEISTRIVGFVDLFRSSWEPGTNRSGVPDSIPTNSSASPANLPQGQQCLVHLLYPFHMMQRKQGAFNFTFDR